MSHWPVVFRVCDSTCQTVKENVEAKSLTPALTERVSISCVVKLEFSMMKNVPLRRKTTSLLTPNKETNTLDANSVQGCDDASELFNHLHWTFIRRSTGLSNDRTVASSNPAPSQSVNVSLGLTLTVGTDVALYGSRHPLAVSMTGLMEALCENRTFTIQPCLPFAALQ